MTSHVSDAELLRKFREIGETSIQSIILGHFRKELDKPDLELNSRVFPKFPQYTMTRKMNVLNRLMVTTCLHKTWPALQDIYPCIHNFDYVVGDADFMFMTRFPFIDLDTHETHGVETVNDFVEFILELIQSLCLPCIYKSDKSCVVLRKQLNEALDKCNYPGSECSETRRKLLNFVIDNLKPAHAGSSTNLQTLPASHRQTVAHSALSRFGDQPNRVDYSKIGTEVQTRLDAKYPGLFETSMNEHVPVSDALRASKNKMDAYGDIREMTDYMVWAIMAGIMQYDEEIFQISFDETGRSNVEYIASGGMKHFLDEPAKMKLESEINLIKSQIQKDGSLALLALEERTSYLDKHPFSKELRCIKGDDGEWKAVFSVEVVGRKMYISDLNYYRSLFTNNHIGFNPKMFFENSRPDGVKLVADFENIPSTSNKPWDIARDSDRARDFARALLDIPFDIGDNNISHEKIAEMAQSFRLAFYGSEIDIDRNDRVSGMILMSEELVEKHPEKLGEVLELVGDNLKTRDELVKIEAKNDLDRLLQQAYRVAEKTDTSIVSALGTAEHLKGVPRLRKAIFDAYQRYIASLGCTRLDQAVEEELGNSAILRYYVKSPGGQEALKKAYDDAVLMRMDKSSSLGWWGKLMRKQRHGFEVNLPVNSNFFRAMWMYNEIEENMYDPEALDLFKNICLSTAYKPLVDNASTLEYNDLISMSKDIDLALQLNQGRMGKDDWCPRLHEVELDFFRDIIMFMCWYAILWALFHKSNRGARTLGHHLAVVGLGWYTERGDLLLMHLLMTGIIVNGWNYVAQGMADRIVPHVQQEEEKKEEEKKEEEQPVPPGNVARELADLMKRNPASREMENLRDPGRQLRGRRVPHR